MGEWTLRAVACADQRFKERENVFDMSLSECDDCVVILRLCVKKPRRFGQRHSWLRSEKRGQRRREEFGGVAFLSMLLCPPLPSSLIPSLPAWSVSVCRGTAGVDQSVTLLTRTGGSPVISGGKHRAGFLHYSTVVAGYAKREQSGVNLDL